MKASELRIGNLCNHMYEKHGEVGSYWGANFVTSKDIKWCEEYPDNYKPIPLNDVMLQRCGGKKSTRGGFEVYEFSGAVSVAVAFLHDCVRVYLNGVYYEVNNFYVHQLQNLYFVITGKELIITL